MRYGFDPAKNAANLDKHGVAFEALERFEWESAIIRADTRFGYGEVRLNALGSIGGRLHFLTFTIRRVVWVISLRKASIREVTFYAGESGDADLGG